MNTSSSARRKKSRQEPETFPYPEIKSRRGFPDSSQTVEAEQQRREAAAREAGRREGEAQALAAAAGQIEEMRAGIAAALDQFAGERREYYLRVERELVQLALSIARKILHRESAIDPLLLAGMAHVLLERMEQSTKTVVRVSPRQVSDFRMFFAQHIQEKQPEVVEDSSLALDRCVITTELGTTEVGPDIQLKEIEQGLLDLEAARPQIKS